MDRIAIPSCACVVRVDLLGMYADKREEKDGGEKQSFHIGWFM